MSKADSKSKEAEIQSIRNILNKFLFIGQVIGMPELNKIESAMQTHAAQQSAADKERITELQKILGEVIACNACHTCAEIAKTALNK